MVVRGYDGRLYLAGEEPLKPAEMMLAEMQMAFTDAGRSGWTRLPKRGGTTTSCRPARDVFVVLLALAGGRGIESTGVV